MRVRGWESIEKWVEAKELELVSWILYLRRGSERS